MCVESFKYTSRRC